MVNNTLLVKIILLCFYNSNTGLDPTSEAFVVVVLDLWMTLSWVCLPTLSSFPPSPFFVHVGILSSAQIAASP